MTQTDSIAGQLPADSINVDSVMSISRVPHTIADPPAPAPQAVATSNHTTTSTQAATHTVPPASQPLANRPVSPRLPTASTSPSGFVIPLRPITPDSING
ncbi:MAG: hypothetical protein K2J78_07990, partial [Muribaculaceae bacterium]|nr:hypothetical protein [Muribaculaceae bacterium]